MWGSLVKGLKGKATEIDALEEKPVEGFKEKRDVCSDHVTWGWTG